MFNHSGCQNDLKFDRILQEKTGTNFNSSDESFIYEVEAEREYVQRLKVQREKIEALYSKYDVLLNELKNRDMIIKEKDRKIGDLESKIKNLILLNEESYILKQEASEVKNQNILLHKNLSQIQEQCEALHNHFKTKEMSSSQRNDQLQILNEELVTKIKALSRKYQEKDQQLAEKMKQMASTLQNFKTEAKNQKSKQLEEIDTIRTELLLRIEENNSLVMENQFLKERLAELEFNFSQSHRQFEEKLDKLNRDKKVYLKTAKIQIQQLRQQNQNLDKKVLGLKDIIAEKEKTIVQLKVLLEEQQKSASDNIFLLRQQSTQERNIMKEQLCYCENHISKLQRRLTQSFRKQKELLEIIRKYEACLDAKRNLRQVQKQELQKINILLSCE